MRKAEPQIKKDQHVESTFGDSAHDARWETSWVEEEKTRNQRRRRGIWEGMSWRM